MSLLCVIPARGGSKRIPRKNIREFCGKPMIAWSIQAALRSGIFDYVIVSTDDAEIADLSRCWGAQVPFVRPSELSDDLTGTTDVVTHAIRWYQDQGYNMEAVCCLYATAPFVSPVDIQQGLQLLARARAERFVFTATAYASPIQRALSLDSALGEARMLQPEQFSVRSQDLEPAYHDAGQFYWGRPKAWLHSQNLFDGSLPLILPRWRVQDIDSEDDWIRADLIQRLLLLDNRQTPHK